MSGLRDSAARPDRAARPDHAARPDRGPGRADRRDGGRRTRTPARHTTAPRTVSPGAPRRITPLLVRAAVLPTLAAGSSGAAAVLFTLRLGARPDGRLWLVLSGCGLLFAGALAAALLGAHRAGRAVRDRCEALRRSSARGQQELRTVLDRLERGETVPERRAGGAPAGEPGRTREPGRAPEPPGPDEFAALSGELREAREQAHAALVRAADLAGRSDSDQKVEVFVNLARRLQSLVHREIQLLDGLEDTVEDPDLLKELFHVDHLATRIRRHAENLAVLGGAASRRQWTRPIDVSEVLRSSVAEVEQYTRVKVVPPAAGSVRGHAVADVVHLLAELVENATVFSPPDTDVVLRAERVTAGIAIEVEDRGLGMPPEEQHRMNALLDDPDQVSVRHLLADGRIGLFVVSALARRHGIAVELKSNIYGGVLAVLVLPRDLLGADAADATRPTVTGTGTGPGLTLPPLEPTRAPAPATAATGAGGVGGAAGVGVSGFGVSGVEVSGSRVSGAGVSATGVSGAGILGDGGTSRAGGPGAVSGTGAGREDAATAMSPARSTATGTAPGGEPGGRTSLPRRVRASAVEQAAIPQQARSLPHPAPGGSRPTGGAAPLPAPESRASWPGTGTVPAPGSGWYEPEPPAPAPARDARPDPASAKGAGSAAGPAAEPSGPARHRAMPEPLCDPAPPDPDSRPEMPEAGGVAGRTAPPSGMDSDGPGPAGEGHDGDAGAGPVYEDGPPPVPGHAPHHPGERTGSGAGPAPRYSSHPEPGAAATAPGPATARPADAAVAPGAPWGAATEARPPTAPASGSDRIPDLTRAVARPTAPQTPGGSEPWAPDAPSLTGAVPQPAVTGAPAGSEPWTPGSPYFGGGVARPAATEVPGGSAASTPGSPDLAGAAPEAPDGTNPVGPGGAGSVGSEPGAAAARPAGAGASPEPSGPGRPPLPRRRAQEHLAPQLRDAPGPAVRPGGGGEQPVHDPQLMAAFRRGFGLAQAAADEDPDA
ncbi:ATP-binding protein [Streptomyces sp. NPDC101132]|uniref:ATP-binding protein n=1 Tax=Streptomyces sp. NPDC101132 TaxID=3366110 RepID=UPI0037F1F59B